MADEDKPPKLEADESSADKGADEDTDTGSETKSSADADANAEAKEAAQKALEDSKELINKGVTSFKKLDVNGQIYLAGLVVCVLCSLIFTAMKVEVSWDSAVSPYRASELNRLEDQLNAYATSIVGGGWAGKLALVSALAGIGLFCWNLMGPRKEAWVPLAMIGAAAFTSLMMLLILFSSGGSLPGALDLGGNEKLDVDMRLLGFWLPFTGAIAATVVAWKQVMKA